MNFFLKKTRNISKAFLMGLILIVASVCTPLSAFAEPLQVAIVPFKVHAEKDLSFLRDGIVDMLSSRLSWADKVTVINSQETLKAFKTVTGSLDETKAQKMGAKLDADYVLFGSLTVIGNSVSIDAKMVDVSGEKQTLSFFNQSQGMDQVIPSINLFASDINEKEFGRVMPSQKAPAASQSLRAQTPQPQTDLRAHPDKLVAGGFAGGEIQETQQTTPASAFISTQASQDRSVKYWKSRMFRKRINGIALGDIDDDGKTETIIIDDNTVDAYRFENKQFLKLKTIAKRSDDKFIGVDVADINGNGYPEIFISALDPFRKSVRSFVLEFNGQTFTEIVKESDWYFGVVETPDRGSILLGQKQGIESPFDKEIFELVWQNSGYEAADKFMPGKRANVRGLALGNAMNDGSQVAVVFDKLDYLRLYSINGGEIWKDGEYSGGTINYFSLPDQGMVKGMFNNAYYPMRILIRDINDDGKNEVITVKNTRLSRLLEFRKFKHGEIEIRSWDGVGVGLAVLWKTRELKGYIIDFSIGDFDNDGQDEIVVSLVSETGLTVTTKPKSSVIAYELK
jgi:TolB-like protein